MERNRICPKCLEPKSSEEMRGTRSDAQCQSCKDKYKKDWYLQHSVTHRRNSSPSATILERLMKYVDIPEDPNACWTWKGATDGKYGHITIKGKQYKVHRLMWTEANGPIPEGYEVCHDCPTGDNKLCINLIHLWPGTRGDNIADAYLKRRKRKVVQLNGAQTSAIRSLSLRFTHSTLARMFHVPLATIREIIPNKARTA